MKPLALSLLVGLTFLPLNHALSQDRANLGATGGNGTKVDFAHEVVPILRAHCLKCHVGDEPSGGLSINKLQDLLSGGDSGPAIQVGKSQHSPLIERIESTDDSIKMPPEGSPVPKQQLEILKRWIDQGATWESGFEFLKPAYEPPLELRPISLPPIHEGRANPIDRIIDNHQIHRGQPIPEAIDDSTFARRTYLDLIGLLPEPGRVQAFVRSKDPNKRTKLVDTLLNNRMAYAEHWLTFWNDLLRNDYDGTGFITGGRKQISKWLYESLITNKPFDVFVRELISPPNEESRGFIEGIKWRGEVSAGQSVEIQFAQNLSQAFLGINLKCASCHDSFIDKWKLDEAYGLAAIYAQEPLEIYRCDVPIGKKASPSWLFPSIGQIDPNASQPERLKQLASLMTHPDNGRLSRTIVNRLWHRLMGYGIVHPTDAMQTKPWNEELLEFLAADLVKNNYDLKSTLRLITTSQAYQSQCEVVKSENSQEYNYAGPRSKRMTAEQFVDSLWQITDTAPTAMDAKFVRGLDTKSIESQPWIGKWIWSTDNKQLPPAGERITFRKQFSVKSANAKGALVISCDNKFVAYLNGKKIGEGDNWERPGSFPVAHFVQGKNELLIVAENQGNAPNPAGLVAQLQIGSDQNTQVIATDTDWEWTTSLPNESGVFEPSLESKTSERKPTVESNVNSLSPRWQKTALVANYKVWTKIDSELQTSLARTLANNQRMMRASLLKSDVLMRTLGRPNRDQIVSMRPNDLSMLEALELGNGTQLADTIRVGAERIFSRGWKSPADFTNWLYWQALSREPSKIELKIASDFLGAELSPRKIEDMLWAVIMLPEFQIVR